MNSTTTLEAPSVSTNAPAKCAGKPAAERYFYAIATDLLLVLVVGFQLFYFHGRMYPGQPLIPPIKGLMIAQGAPTRA